MREWIKLSMPKQETAFLKASQPLGGGTNSSNQAEGNGETPFWNLWWWLYMKEEEDGVAPLTSARKTYQKFFVSAQDGGQNPSNPTQDDGESWPSNQFGRGQAVSSVQYSSVSTGWYPKPQWRLLGGAGGKQKKMGPTTKARESQNGNYFFMNKYTRSFVNS